MQFVGCLVGEPGFHLPTGPAKPPGSGTGIPVRFGRNVPDPGGLAGNRSVPVEFKFEFKIRSSTGSYRYTGRLDRFTSRFDRFEFKSKFKIACVIGLEWYTSRFDRFTKWVLMGRLIFSFSFWFNFKCPKSMLNERIFEKI